MTEFKKIVADWKLVKNLCRSTDNKEFTENDPSYKFKEKLLISEHSPIRLLEFTWTWRNIPYWVSTEWSRHKFEKFISTQRTDRTGIKRDELPQNAPVTFNGNANMQNLIDAWRKRLCYKATPEARKLAEDFREELLNDYPLEATVLVPNCVYRCGCPEFTPCGFFKKFLEFCEEDNRTVTNIDERYYAYTAFIEKEIKRNAIKNN